MKIWRIAVKIPEIRSHAPRIWETTPRFCCRMAAKMLISIPIPPSTLRGVLFR